ncbi:LPS-assembly protein LptD [Erythrobacteraceae bacterium CFH 75059]|nr:LPS-assembly protein LptD [Erythrobacteraceae bacterium CFH 75059]
MHRRLALLLTGACLTGLIVPGQARAQDAVTGREALQPRAAEREQPAPQEQDAPSPAAQGVQETTGGPATPAPGSADAVITFSANQVQYLADTDTVIAIGDVFLESGGRSVRSARVVWNRTTGAINAEGEVLLVDENGNQLFADSIALTDAFDAGTIDNLLLALSQGGRIAAASATRLADGTLVLERAAYSSCAVVDGEGADRCPTWRITADSVTYDPVTERVRFRGATFELFGRRILPLPGLSLRTDGSAASGILLPDVRISRNNGIELSGSYYWRLAPNRDVTATATLFTGAPPMISGQWRHLTELGAYQVTGYLTGSRRIGVGPGEPTAQSDIRGYVFTNGRLQFDPLWSLTGSVRLASDRTFLRRYDISREDRLRSVVELERIDASSYLSVAGWATQTLRLNVEQGQQPIALPVVDYRRRLADPLAGGTIDLQLNSLSIVRTSGQDTQRAFASATWQLRSLTPLGQILSLTALGRGDVYHTADTLLTDTAAYRGTPGWQARLIGTAAVDLEWPLVGPAFGGTQVVNPRVQLVASPPIRNLAVPNEDARAFDLEDSNLFALNRFPGYDRIEDGVRLVYGVDWRFNRPGLLVRANVGQSLRLSGSRDFLIDGTGISERVSDFVGRTQVRLRDRLTFTHRFRIDKDSLVLRRNELDAAFGTAERYVEIGYLRLNRDIDDTIEDLQDREEVRFAARTTFRRYWSVFASGNINLTDAAEDPLQTSDGFQPIRTRLGVAYSDDCLEMGVTWRRDYVTAGDARRGDTFQFTFALRNIGFRR